MSLVADAGSHLLPPADREKAAAIAAALRRAARKSRVPVMSISGGGGFRARKSDKLFWAGVIVSFIFLVVAPLVVATAYFGLIASEQYASDARMALRTGDASILDSLGGMPGLPSSTQAQDSQIIVNFIHSRAMIEKIDQQLDLKRIYSREDADWWARFDPTKKAEDLEKYWAKRVEAGLDRASSIIALEVRAFTPQDALALTTKIIENSEELVNRLSERARGDAVRDSKAELTRAEARLTEAILAMRDERNKVGSLNLEATAMAVEKVVVALRIELARMQQEMAVLSKSVRPDAPQARILNRKIDNVNAQIAAYMSQIGNESTNGNATLADRMEGLSRRQSDLEIAQKLYASASVAYESARVDAESKHGYLTAFMRPTLAQKAIYPRRWLGWSLITIPALFIWAVLIGLASLVRDHMAA